MSTENMNMLFVAGFGPIVRDETASRELYAELLGIPFEGENGYLHTAELPGVRHFALWPLAQAAESCFGRGNWPNDIPTPQAWIEFDVEDVEKATAALEANDYDILVATREEPWGQTVSRLIGPDGLLVGITHTPWMREAEYEMDTTDKTTSRDDAFDEETILHWLRDAWSPESSSLWTEDNPARGQCGVTALVIQDRFGGEIRKTPMEDETHFYNYIDGQRYDLTAEQFEERPVYLDLPSDREEAFGDTNTAQYTALSERFRVVADE